MKEDNKRIKITNENYDRINEYVENGIKLKESKDEIMKRIDDQKKELLGFKDQILDLISKRDFNVSLRNSKKIDLRRISHKIKVNVKLIKKYNKAFNDGKKIRFKLNNEKHKEVIDVETLKLLIDEKTINNKELNIERSKVKTDIDKAIQDISYFESQISDKRSEIKNSKNKYKNLNKVLACKNLKIHKNSKNLVAFNKAFAKQKTLSTKKLPKKV